MRGLLSVLMAILICLSCKKADTSTFISTVLAHHTWHPYQLRIITDDTMIASVINNNVISHTDTKIIHLDTTMLLDECMQRITFKFQTNGRLLINNPCYPPNSNVDTTWTLMPFGLLRAVSISYPQSWIYYKNHFSYLFFPVDSTYSYWPSLGHISWITDNEFIYNNNNPGDYVDFTTWNNSGYTDTVHRQHSHMFTTYRSQ